MPTCLKLQVGMKAFFKSHLIRLKEKPLEKTMGTPRKIEVGCVNGILPQKARHTNLVVKAHDPQTEPSRD